MNKEVHFYAQNYRDLIILSLIASLMFIPLIFLTKGCVTYQTNNNGNHYRDLFLNVLMVVTMICNQIFLIMNYRYLIKNGLKKFTKLSWAYVLTSSIGFTLIAVLMEIFVTDSMIK